MTKKDILELKRRFKKNDCTFTKLRGCYVDGQKNIVLHINETFLNLVDEEFYKYLEIANKTLSGTIGNNMLELEFMPDEENNGGKQQFLLGLRDSRLKNDDLLERLYELIIENYEYTGNYLILVYHDAYDVITRTNDNDKLDESEEVYEYLLCAICPVELSKPGLGYREDENRIGARIRDWVVGVPETGFVFPAFSDRSSDIHAIMYHTKNPKESHPEFMESGLGCFSKRTAAEEKKVFQNIIQNVAGDDDNSIFMEIQQSLSNIVDEHKTIFEKEPVLLTENTIKSVVDHSGIPEEIAEKIEKYCLEEFGDTPPSAENLIDPKSIEAHATKKKEQELQKEVITLKQQLDQSNLKKAENLNDSEPTSEDETEEKYKNNYDIVLNVKPQKLPEIKTQVIDGKKCIIIPVDENEQAAINGVTSII